MSKYGTIPTAAAASSTTPPPEESSPTALDPPTSCATCPRAFPFRSWRELLDPRGLSAPRGLAAAHHRARANLARFAGNYHLAFLVVFSVSLLWRPRCLPSVLPCFLLLSSARFFPVIMALTLLQNMLTGAAASVLVSLPVGILLVVTHAVLHCPADCADDEDDDEAASIVWRAPRIAASIDELA